MTTPHLSLPISRLLHEPRPLSAIAERPSYHWLVVATVCVGAFMGQLDASIVSLVLPTLEDTFHSHVSHVQWVAIIYLLVLTGLVVPLGRVADHLGRKSLYTIGFVVFAAASALCGLAPTLSLLIVARAIQGVGAALLQANSVAIITSATPREQLGRAIGVQGVAQALGLAIGPTVGGVLIAWVDWRWIFLVNLPIGLLGAALGVMILPASSHAARIEGFNRLGALLLPAAIATLLLALTFLNLIVLLVPITALLLLAFIWSEQHSEHPLLGAALLRAPGLTAGLVAGLLSYTVLFGALFAVPILLERAFSEGPDRAGLILTTVPAALAVVALAGGLLTDKLGPKLPTVSGMVIAAAGLAVVWWAAADALAWLVGGLVLLGLGSGLFVPANNASIMASAPRTHLGVTGGALNMMRGLGTSFGVALVGLVLSLRLGAVPSHIAPVPDLVGAIRLIIVGLVVSALLAGVLSFGRRSTRTRSRVETGDIL